MSSSSEAVGQLEHIVCRLFYNFCIYKDKRAGIVTAAYLQSCFFICAGFSESPCHSVCGV